MHKRGSWNLVAVKPKSLDIAMKLIAAKTKLLESKRSKLNNNISQKNFMQFIYDLESLRKITSKFAVFAHLRFCENSTNQQALADMSKVETFLTKQGNKLVFFSLWFKQLPVKKAQQLIRNSGPYSYFLESMWQRRKYVLKEDQEKIINIKDTTGVSALNNIYNIFTSKFVYKFQGKDYSQEEIVTFVRSTSSKNRKEAYLALLKPYKENKEVIGEIYKNIINDWREENVGLRKYSSPINVRNSYNDIPDKAIDVMLKVCEKNQNIFHKFFEIKRKKLGLKKLRRFDIYAPLKEEKDSISYDKAVNIVLDTFNSFSPVFGQHASTIINNNHVHSNIQKGKRSGAFCCPASNDIPPYVMLTYTKKYRDVSTLAHELGHGIHFMLSQKQTEFTSDACLPLAETASIFSEMLLSEKVMKDNPDAAKNMLFTKLDDLYASIIRQAGFVSFERKAHQMMKDGKTIDEMSSVYLTDLKKQLGPKVEVDPIYSNEWCYIPHIFHTPFYCYAYAFGNLLTLAIYAKYKKEGKKFVPKVIEMLSLGGSAEPVKIAKVVGVDITSEKFWQSGFDYIAKMIKEIE
jgi:oligoendopeptidase F